MNDLGGLNEGRAIDEHAPVLEEHLPYNEEREQPEDNKQNTPHYG